MSKGGDPTIHEHDPRWTDVDNYLLPHLQPPSPLQTNLHYVVTNAEKHDLPDIAVSALQGQFLALQCKLLNAKHVLEVGTLGGYSTIWLASTGEDVHVTSVEVDEMHAAVARESIANAGLADRVDVIVGPGLGVLPRLRAEVEQGKRPKFDFTFIDADKGNNWAYLDEAVGMSRSRAGVVVDNVVRRGRVADDGLAETDESIRGSRRVIEGAAGDERVDASVLQLVGEKNYDGVLVCCVK